MQHVTRHNTPIHNTLSTAPQLNISQKALGTLPEDDNVMPKHKWIIGVFVGFSRIFLMGILIFKRLTARRLYKSFGVKGLKTFSIADLINDCDRLKMTKDHWLYNTNSENPRAWRRNSPTVTSSIMHPTWIGWDCSRVSGVGGRQHRPNHDKINNFLHWNPLGMCACDNRLHLLPEYRSCRRTAQHALLQLFIYSLLQKLKILHCAMIILGWFLLN
jgi:hypothetical protein